MCCNVNKKKYAVAVIIPTLNEESFIRQCLDSVICQSYPYSDMDIMVIDGGSEDKTTSIVKEISEEYSNVRLLVNSKKIQSVAFNIGVEQSDAPYVIRLDAHAIYDKDYIKLCLKHLQNDSSVGNVGGVWNILPKNNGIIAGANAILNKSKFGIGGASFRVGAAAGYVDTVPFGAFPRHVIEEIGGMREDLPRGEDNEFNSRIRKNGYRIFFDPSIISTYYSRDTVYSSIKQMYTNGVSIGHLLHLDRQSLGIRHLVPLFFFLGIIVGFVLSFFSSVFFYAYLSILGTYVILAFLASICACTKYGFRYLMVLPWLFFLVHISYGYGTLVGIIKGRQ